MSTVIDNDSGIATPAETQTAIALMGEVAAGLAELKTTYATMPDVSTDDGYTQAKKERKAIGDLRIKVEKAHKKGKAFYLDGGRGIDAMKNTILETVSTLENERKTAIKAIDDEADRVAQEAAEKEQARIEALEERISVIKSAPSDAVTLSQCIATLDQFAYLDFEPFDEFIDMAKTESAIAVTALEAKRVELQTQAAEAERLETQRKEQESAAAKLAEQQAEIQRQQRDIEEAKRAEEQRKQAEIDKQEALKIAESTKFAAIEQTRIDAEKAAERAETKRLADVEEAKQQAVRDEQARVDAENKRKAEEQAEADRVAAEAPDKQQLESWLDSMPKVKGAAGKKAAKTIHDHAANVLMMMGTTGKRSTK